MTKRSEQWHYIKTGLRRLRIAMNGYRRDSQSAHFLFLSAAILETSHRIPNLDYDILMKLTLQLTKSMEECEKLYRLMCFNVFAHNRDDHSKNFSYISGMKRRDGYFLRHMILRIPILSVESTQQQ